MSNSCAIWGTRTVDSSRSFDVHQFDSPRAGGKYEITGTALVTIKALDDRQKAYLTSWLVDQRQIGNEVPTVTDVEVQGAKLARQKSLTQRRDCLLLAVSSRTPTLGETMRYREQAIIRTVGEPPRENPHWAESYFLLAASESLKTGEVIALLEFATQQGLLKDDSGRLSLTFEGHGHLEKLVASPQVSVQAFVAMWFGAEVSDAYSRGIAPAIADAGYTPMRIDQKEHNNKIDDEIIAEIRRSRFVIADFTCGLLRDGDKLTPIPRGGVYYEAGFAQGLGIPVIWSCREDHIGHVHFDTRQFNHITWTTPEDLRKKLKNRIGSVIGDGPLKLSA